MRLIGLYSPYPQMGKGTFANAMHEKVPDSSILSFADPMRDMAACAVGMAEGPIEVLKDKDGAILPLLDCTYRHLLNTLGTEWGRKCIHPDIWVRIARQRYLRAIAKGYSVIFDDVRFENEYDMIRDAGGVLVKIVRPGVELVDRHEAHARLEASSRKWDHTIENDGDIEDLKFKALALAWKLGLA